ncbi:MAG TPA: FAD binding domain-containing protein [Candidatus Limnocylindrales bacterium]
MTVAEAPAAVVRFSVDGLPVEYRGPGGRRLLDVLRVDLGLTGAKEGCGEGECGLCSVLLDGLLVDSCLVPIAQVDRRTVRTIEGLLRAEPAERLAARSISGDGQVGLAAEPGSVERLGRLQAAFLEAGAVQCGFCTPAMVLAGQAFLEARASRGERTVPAEDAVREAIAGTLCRCTGYVRIVEAIRAAAPLSAEAAVPPDPAAAALRPRLVEAGSGRRPAPPVRTAASLDEALALVADGWRPLAGGTDLLVALAADATVPEPLVDLSRLAELRGIGLERDGAGGDILVIGALTTYAELRGSPLVAERLPALAEMAAAVGAVQVQARGTIGGNVATASPAGDSLPVLLATDAELVLVGPSGQRVVPAASFFTAYRCTALAPDELLLRLRVPLPPGRHVRFRKVGTRRAQAISKVVLALAWREEAGRWRDVRVALGSVAPTPLRAPRTEALLDGRGPSPEVADLAAATVVDEITPIDDVRSTAAYRRLVSGRILRRLILHAS